MFHYSTMTACKLLVMMMVVVHTIAALDQSNCQAGSTYLGQIGHRSCYALLDLANGTVTFEEAKSKCGDFIGGWPVNVKNKVSVIYSIFTLLYFPKPSLNTLNVGTQLFHR